MSLAAIISNLATRGGTVSGITSSFDQDDTPEELQDAELPALLHFPGGGVNTRETHGGSFWAFAHTIRVPLYYKPAAEGRLEDNLGGVVDLIDSYMASIRSYDTAGGECVDVVVTRYGEPGELKFAEVGYVGTIFTLEATEYVYP